ncbi:MAG: FAD-binding oxidoreductase [Candidatus Rokubacteria bacterium]|nr:FAD-binding oxidoreductase [Candidatus Rokubacteria bacterium]
MTDRRKSFYAWGYEGEGASDAEVKAFEAIVARRFGLGSFDVTPPPTPADIALRAPRVTVPASLATIVSTDHRDRLEHSYGKNWYDVARMFLRAVPSPPDAIAFPRDEADVVRVLGWCDEIGATVIPYGGGSSVVSGIEPPADAARVVTLDLRHLDRVLDVDRVSHAARIQAGVYGPALEAQLKPSGFTLRHYMQAYECSSLGGWIATRSGGHFVTLYTHIDDVVQSLRVVTPAGTLETRRLPGSGAGPAPDRLFIGSEGILGIITEAWVRIRPKPVFRTATSVRFKDYYTGADAVRDITQSGLYPANCRLLEASEASPTAAIDEPGAVLVLAFESADHPLDAWMKRALEICEHHGGTWDRTALGAADPQRQGAAGEWRDKFIRMPYFIEHLAARGVMATTVESAITWDRFKDFHAKVIDTGRRVMREVTGRDGSFTCRFTHLYPDGPAPYFSLQLPLDKPVMLRQYMEIKHALLDALVANGGTVTHHHAVGRVHRPYYDRERPELFAAALRAAKKALDPRGLLNPGVLIDP